MKRIHVDDIIEEAAKFKGWYLGDFNQIRIASVLHWGGSTTCCPMTCGIFDTDPRSVFGFTVVSNRLNIARRTVKAIMMAADNNLNHNPRLRKKMLKAFGLDE